MIDDDFSYLVRRVDQELALAQKARHPRAVAAHYQLSCAYLDQLELLTGTKRATAH